MTCQLDVKWDTARLIKHKRLEIRRQRDRATELDVTMQLDGVRTSGNTRLLPHTAHTRPLESGRKWAMMPGHESQGRHETRIEQLFARDMTPTHLIDGNGDECSLAHSPVLRRLGNSSPLAELALFAVRNLGCIATATTNRLCQLWIRPTHAKPIALAAAFEWVATSCNKRVCISEYGREWSEQLFPDRVSAIQFLIGAETARGYRRHDFLRRRRPADDLASTPGLIPLLQTWRDLGGRIDRDRLNHVLTGPVADRYVLIEVCGQTPIVRDFGTGIVMLDDHWRQHGRGARLQDMYDFAFGRWSAQTYVEALPSCVPVLEEIDVTANVPGRSRRRFCYKRIILPFQADDGSTVLLGASALDPTIDLRMISGIERQ